MDKKQIRTRIELPDLWERDREVPKEEKPADRRLPQLIRNALDAYEKGLQSETFKPTLAEYLKLLQIEKEVSQEGEGPREITVTWIEPEANYSEE